MEVTTTAVIQDALEQAATAHNVYETEVLNGVYDVDWAAWYAEHMARTFATKDIN